MLYVITHDATGHIEIAKAALAAGVKLIQFRSKKLSTREQFAVASQIKKLTDEYQALFIVNDRLDLALAVKASGVHLGENDLPIKEARKLAGRNFLIGASAATLSAAQKAVQEGADYLGVGPVYVTATKPDAGKPIGLANLKLICQAVSVPIFAIGGINLQNVNEVLAAGAAGVATVSEALPLIAAYKKGSMPSGNFKFKQFNLTKVGRQL